MIRVSQGIVKKYSDEDAVAAVDASNEFIERNVENIVSGTTTFKRSSTGTIIKGIITRNSFMFSGMLFNGELESTNTNYLGMLGMMDVLRVGFKGTDITRSSQIKIVKTPGGQETAWYFNTIDSTGGTNTRMQIEHNKIDVKNLPIKDQKNHAHSALSGVKRVVEILIGGTPYYFEVYPTKA